MGETRPRLQGGNLTGGASPLMRRHDSTAVSVDRDDPSLPGCQTHTDAPHLGQASKTVDELKLNPVCRPTIATWNARQVQMECPMCRPFQATRETQERRRPRSERSRSGACGAAQRTAAHAGRAFPRASSPRPGATSSRTVSAPTGSSNSPGRMMCGLRMASRTEAFAACTVRRTGPSVQSGPASPTLAWTSEPASSRFTPEQPRSRSAGPSSDGSAQAEACDVPRCQPLPFSPLAA